MTVEYTRRAVADLHKVAADSAAFGENVSTALEGRIREIVDRIAAHPDLGAQVAGRPGIRVASLIHYPFKIFYRVLDDGDVQILHIRHTARRPWTGKAKTPDRDTE